jgi:lipopolysaccharide assembly outer membrane protein LptD (OstA)
MCSAGIAGQEPQRPDSDTLSLSDLDSVVVDSSQFDTLRVAWSRDSIDGDVLYKCRDSSEIDRKKELMVLWGEAEIRYGDFIIEADQIIIDLKASTAEAIGIKGDTSAFGYCRFKDGTQEVLSDRMIYNFKTKRFISYTTRTKESDLYIIAEKSKFVSDDKGGGIFYSKNGVFTTCDAVVPHYGIRSSKQKIIPDEVAVVGISNVEISEVPTPLVLPFGFFPLVKKARKGIIFPSDYESSELWGFGLRNIGYYIPINDYVDATILADIYLRGSFGISMKNNYKKRYRYAGNTDIGYSYRTQENTNTGKWVPQKSFSISWRHTQDPNANPNASFNGSLNFQTNNFLNLNFNDANSVLTNTINSNVYYQRRFPGKPYTFSASLMHSQNTQTRRIDVSFPTMDFQLQRIFPFRRKQTGVVRKTRWYEDISLTYNNKFENKFSNTDTAFFTRSTLDSTRLGMSHDANLTSNFRILKYINVVPNVRYREVWYTRTINRTFDPTIQLNPVDTLVGDIAGDSIIVFDTIFGQLNKQNVNGFRAWRTVDFSTSLNTQVFGTLQFRRGPLKGLRHVMKPSFSFNYSPDYTDARFDYYRSVQRSLSNMDSLFYSVFEEGIFGAPSRGGRQANLNYSLNNIFEGKYRFKRDTADRKFKIMDNIIVNGNYNMAADSFKWSTVNIRGTHRLFKGMTTITAGVLLDPYAVNAENRRINTLYWTTNRKLLRFQNFNFQINSNLDVRTIRTWFEKPDVPGNTESPGKPTYRSVWDIFENFSISHSLIGGITRIQGRDTFMLGTNNVTLNGSMQITDKWRINVGNIGYDFNSKQITYPDFGFYRDLHCWEMGMDWQPLRGTYNFFIRVKPSSLDFLKVPYRKNNVDGLQRL